MWFTVRVACLILATILGFASSFKHAEQLAGLSRATATAILLLMALGLLLLPSLMLGIIRIQALNPLSADVWKPPGSSEPFLNFRDPLQFFHFGAWSSVFFGAGHVLGGFFAGWIVVALGTLQVLGGVVGLYAVRLCVRRFKSKYRQSDADDTGKARTN